ncbi:MAG: hypothetical protein ACTHK1_10900 [Actinomycetales bacterium]
MSAAVDTTTAPTSSRLARLALLGAAGAAVVIAAGNYNVPKGENGGLDEAIQTAILCAIVAAGVFGLVLPRVHTGHRTAVVLGVLTILSVAVFWSGLTPILAAATWGANDAHPAGRGVVVLRWVAAGLAALTVIWSVATSHVF